MIHILFGGSGFIAFHLRNYIVSHDPHATLLNVDIKKNFHPKESVYIDVRKPFLNIPDFSLDGVPPENVILYNLAAVHVTPGYRDEEYWETNTAGAEHVCDFARVNNINTIVFTSSISVYGSTDKLKSENGTLQATSAYGKSKIRAEQIHQVWQAEDAVHRRLFIVRPGVVFGQHEGGNFTRLYNSLKKGYFFYPGRKDTIKAAVYVKDVARILYEGGQKKLPETELYNLSLFPAPTITEICHTMSEVTGVREPRILVPGWLLESVAGVAYFSARLFGLKINGIHPDRVKKLMVSTNVSGERLSRSPYRLHYSLRTAIEDWFADCGRTGLE